MATYRIKSAITCQTSSYSDYVNIQKFLEERKVALNLLGSAGDKRYKVVMKRMPLSRPPYLYSNEGVPVTAWRDKSPLTMHIMQPDHATMQLDSL